jgi:hypothetical protein
VSPADLSDLHVIRYEPERDLLPLVLSNCQYSVERGQEALHEYDLPKIQQQILARFLQGKPLITLNVSLSVSTRSVKCTVLGIDKVTKCLCCSKVYQSFKCIYKALFTSADVKVLYRNSA